MDEDRYPAYCKECDYEWKSQAKNKPPTCPKCRTTEHVVYGDDVPVEEGPGEPLAEGVDEGSTITDNAKAILEMTEEDIDWDRIKNLEREHKERTVAIYFKDTKELFGIQVDSQREEVNVMDRKDLNGFTGNPEGMITFAKEEIGWQVIQGEIPIQVVRYEYPDDMVEITAEPGRENMFWLSCSSIFNDIRKSNIDIIEEVKEV